MTRGYVQVVKRSKLIALGGASRLLVSLSNVIVSFIIIRFHSAAVWGEFVSFIILMDLGFSIISWGVTPYLVREFSLHPQKIKNAWSEATMTRTLLLVAFLVIALMLPFSYQLKISFVVWAGCRFIYTSFEPIVQVERNFLFSLAIELIAIVAIVIPAFLIESLQADTLVLLFAGSLLIKALAYSLYLRRWISISLPRLVYFKKAFPFLLLTFSAMLQQRMDLFCVAYFLDDENTAVYQVFLNFLIFGQFLSSLLLSPFAKNIFRLAPKSLRKLENRFMAAGLPLALLTIAGIFIVITYFYQFNLSMKIYIMGYFYILLSYLYLIRNYELGKMYRQTEVAVYSFAASVVNLTLSIVLTPKFGIEGALLAGLGAQIFLVALYQKSKIKKNSPWLVS